MDMLYLLKENFKNLLFYLLIIGTSFKNLSYLSGCSLHKDEDSEEYARAYYEALNQTLLHHPFMAWKLMAYPVRSSILENSEFFH